MVQKPRIAVLTCEDNAERRHCRNRAKNGCWTGADFWTDLWTVSGFFGPRSETVLDGPESPEHRVSAEGVTFYYRYQ